MNQLIVSDFDGTLINTNQSHFSIPDKMIHLIDQFQKKGGLFTIATGRPLQSLWPLVSKLPIATPMITHNGAIIYHPDRTILFESSFPMHPWYPVLERWQKEGINFLVFTSQMVYASQFSDWTKKYQAKEKLLPSLLDLSNRNNELRATKLILLGDLDRSKKLVKDLPFELCSQFETVASEDFYLEIIQKGIHKGYALSILHDYLSIDPKNTIAIGNHANDLSMFQAVGVGIAVSNSSEDLLHAADIISAYPDSQAVMHVLESCLQDG